MRIAMLLFSFLVALVASVASCPSTCSCSEEKSNCTAGGLTSWPTTLPLTTTTLILSGNQISQVSAQDLQLYENLHTLLLDGNSLRSVDAAKTHPNLEKMDVSGNRLSELNFLSSLPNLRQLEASSNLVSVIDNATLAKNVKLEWLSLNDNPLADLPPSAFDNNFKLEFLMLSGLQVTSIPAKLLDPLTHLTHVEIRNNINLESLRDDLFYYQGNLKYLRLSNNSLRSIPRSLRNLKAMVSLDLDDNPFECDCQMFWFANWMEKKPAKLKLSNGTVCADRRPTVEQLLSLQCSAVQLETSSLIQEVVYGQDVILTCNFSGTPLPTITWITPDQTVLRWPSVTESNDTLRHSVSLLSAAQLQVGNVTRFTAGDYACHASNALSNVTAFMRIQITPTSFRQIQLRSLIVGGLCVFAFCFITLIVQGFRYVMDRFGWWECCYCCGRRLSPRAQQARNLLEAIEQYKSQQLDRLRDNYNGQVHRIRENCNQQMDRIQQGYSGQVRYLRGVRDYGTQQLTTIRDQYNDQAKKVYDYTVDRLQTVQRNYVSQRIKVRKFSAHQLIRLREKYKFQQKTLNKILENLPAFYIDSCRTATCARTDSIYFEDETDVDTVDSIMKQGIHLDLDLPDVGLEDLEGDEDMEEQQERKKHRRQPSSGSLGLDFLFAPIRFPALQWRRRNIVLDEEDPPAATSEVVQVAVEICPVPAARGQQVPEAAPVGTPETLADADTTESSRQSTAD